MASLQYTLKKRIKMMKHSAGILPYKYTSGTLQVYLEHPGGPYWQNKDLWSICKGEYKQEKALDAALREFKEETGFNISSKDFIFLGSKKQSSTNKLVTIFAVNIDLDPTKMISNTFTIEWPPFSNNIQKFPEMDKAAWFPIEEAKEKIFPGQKYFLEKLHEIESKN